MNRIGMLVKFKVGTTEAQVKAALAKAPDLMSIIEPDVHWPHTKPYQSGEIADYSRPVPLPHPRIERYNDEHGGPVWYIP